MERLTKWENGHAYYPRCFEKPCYGGGCVTRDCPFETAICERLAAYEDTGLMPEEASAFYKAPCVRSKKLESISLKARTCVSQNDVETFGRESALERARNDVTDKIVEDARDFIKVLVGVDMMGNVRADAELRVWMPEDDGWEGAV